MEGSYFEFDYSKDNSTTKERAEMIYKILCHGENVKAHAQSCNQKLCKVCIKIDFLSRILIANQKMENKEIDFKKLFEDEIMDEYFFTDKIISPVALSLGIK